MNETTPAPAWTESRIARTAWDNLRKDLFRDIWGFRPLPPVGEAGLRRRPLLRRLGGRWFPHAVVGFTALFLLVLDLLGAPWERPGFLVLLLGLAQTVPLALTLLRPLGAWWVSFGVFVFMAVTDSWQGPGVLAHLGVMIVVALRTRPRVALEMWAISVLSMGWAGVVFAAGGAYLVFPAAVFSGCVLGTVVALRGWWLARNRVEEQETLVADVRGRHTALEERARIARELHDVVAHHMSVIAIQAEAAPYRVEDAPEELTRSFGTIRESAVEALSELRRVLGVLRFDGAGSLGVPDAPQPDLSRLDELVQGVRDVGLDVEIARTGAERPLPQGVELSAYRIVQEALSNALRHAPGSRVRVEVAYVLTGLGLRIVNTAPTGAVSPSPGMGHGVTGMRERAVMLGGELTAEPTAEGGYEVAAFLPAGPVEDEEREAPAGRRGASPGETPPGRVREREPEPEPGSGPRRPDGPVGLAKTGAAGPARGRTSAARADTAGRSERAGHGDRTGSRGSGGSRESRESREEGPDRSESPDNPGIPDGADHGTGRSGERT
ncbi:two-component sensor histidine kinase [Streptomyces sp. F63]|uniref:histidine kinase n=1 Tax=Streptomyces sp. F63 TaxID=2824887 RepID=UPI001B371989|nr:histidine kinase [Streptomyces sp. F63]MBQ0983022.1 two-component sensor histidine kinase [Streptomyces sp. F63]